MRILVINAGSSSLKFSIFDADLEDSQIFKGEFERFQQSCCNLHIRVGGENGTKYDVEKNICNIEDSIAAMPEILAEYGFSYIDAIGHRIAHGGTKFTSSVIINEEVMAEIAKCTPLAPLHNPINIKAVEIALEKWPNIPQIAVFDTSFHHTIPAKAYNYAVPKEWRDKGLRRYGFHGTSHKYVVMRAAEHLGLPSTDLRIISCHLGNGASICAVDHGFSVDTSMGMTPLEGLMMGTRSGDVDPGIFSFLNRELGLSIEQIEQQLYSASGLKALAGGNDMRDIEDRAASGDQDAQLAINIYAYRVKKYIGAYAAAMGGADVIAFTGGIGENSRSMRWRICDGLEYMGAYFDKDLNDNVQLDGFDVANIHEPRSRIKLLVTQTNEQWMIAEEVVHVLNMMQPKKSAHLVKIPVAVSARHAHLTNEAVEQLFGKGEKLTLLKKLSQPEGWASEQRIQVVGPKGTLRHVRVLGPTRDHNQIEISKTDSFVLGVDPPIRPSGKLDNTPSIKLIGPAGEIVTDGLIIAQRHIHTNPKDAENLGLKDGDYVDVMIGNHSRGIVLTNTLIRVKDSFVTEMHIDTDEANAADISFLGEGELIYGETEQDAGLLSFRHMNLKRHIKQKKPISSD